MTSRLSLLLASTALSVALGLPALAAMQARGTAEGLCSGVRAAVFGADERSVPLVRVSGHDDDDKKAGGWFRRKHDDDDDDDDDDCAGAARNPAPAGTVAPPANGLFGTGKPPVAVTN